MLHSSRIQSPSELCSQPNSLVLYRGYAVPGGANSVVRFHLGEFRDSPLPTRTALKTLSFNGFSWGPVLQGPGSLPWPCCAMSWTTMRVRFVSVPTCCDFLVRNMSAANCWSLTDSGVRLAVESIETAMGWNWVEKQKCYADEIPV